MVEECKKASRNYAKRQYTWFQNQMDISWFSVDYIDFSKTIQEVVQYIENQSLWQSKSFFASIVYWRNTKKRGKIVSVISMKGKVQKYLFLKRECGMLRTLEKVFWKEQPFIFRNRYYNVIIVREYLVK